MMNCYYLRIVVKTAVNSDNYPQRADRGFAITSIGFLWVLL